MVACELNLFFWIDSANSFHNHNHGIHNNSGPRGHRTELEVIFEQLSQRHHVGLRLRATKQVRSISLVGGLGDQHHLVQHSWFNSYCLNPFDLKKPVAHRGRLLWKGCDFRAFVSDVFHHDIIVIVASSFIWAVNADHVVSRTTEIISEGNNNVRKKSSKQSSEKRENLEKQNFVLSLLGLWCSPPQQSRPHPNVLSGSLWNELLHHAFAPPWWSICFISFAHSCLNSDQAALKTYWITVVGIVACITTVNLLVKRSRFLRNLLEASHSFPNINLRILHTGRKNEWIFLTWVEVQMLRLIPNGAVVNWLEVKGVSRDDQPVGRTLSILLKLMLWNCYQNLQNLMPNRFKKKVQLASHHFKNYFSPRCDGGWSQKNYQKK